MAARAGVRFAEELWESRLPSAAAWGHAALRCGV